MTALIFDSGGLIAIERRNRQVGALLKVAAQDGFDVVTSSACVAQVWRDPARQALLTRALPGFIEHPLNLSHARAVGQLLAAAGTSDVVDAAVVTLADDGDTLLTSDPDDLCHLASAANIEVRVVGV